MRFKSHRIRQLTVATLSYTLIASTLLYFYSHQVCFGRDCNSTALYSNRRHSIFRTNRDIGIYVGPKNKENENIKEKMHSQSLEDKGIQSRDKHILGQFTLQKIEDTSKDLQMVFKAPVDKVKIRSNTKMMPVKNNNGQAGNQIIKGPVDARANMQCKGDFIRGSNAHIPRTALASSPGSGNTWTRHLLQQATGLSTGSIYGDALLQRNGFKDESKCVKSDTCLVVKTHEWKTYYQTRYDRAILILRHPRDSVVSSFHYFNGGLHVKEAKPEMFHTDHWVRFAEERIQFWFGLNNDWVTKFRNPLYIIFYEELKANPISQTEKAVNFLNFTMTKTDKTCMEKNLQGNFQRKHHNKFDIDSLYTDSLKAFMDKRVQELTTAIQERFPGKSVIWTNR